jgi:hypothetical protein
VLKRSSPSIIQSSNNNGREGKHSVHADESFEKEREVCVENVVLYIDLSVYLGTSKVRPVDRQKVAPVTVWPGKSPMAGEVEDLPPSGS